MTVWSRISTWGQRGHTTTGLVPASDGARPWHSVLEQPAAQLTILVCVGALVRLIRLTYSLTADEGFSLHAATIGFAEMLRFVATHDPHPPLFYLLLSGWVRLGLGRSEFALRMLPVLLGLTTVAMTFLWGVRLLGTRIAFLAGMLVALSPFLVRWSQEARLYSLVPLITLCSLYALIQVLRRDRLKHWLWYGLSVLASLYTVYSSVLVLFAYQVVAVWWWSRTRKPSPGHWLICHALVALAVLPWGLFAARHGSPEHIIVSSLSSAAYSVLWALHQFTTGTLAPNFPLLKGIALASVLIAASGFQRALRMEAETRNVLLVFILATAIPVGIGGLLELRGIPMLATLRLFVGIIVPLLFCLAAGIVWLRPPAVRLAVGCVLLALNVLSLSKWTVEGYPYTSDMRSQAAHISVFSSGSEVLVIGTGYIAYALDFYLKKEGQRFLIIAYWGREDLDAVRGAIPGKSEVWLSKYVLISTDSLETYLKRTLGYRRSTQTQYHLVTLERYEAR